MSLAVKQSKTRQQARQKPPMRRIWKAPASRARWFWLVGGALLYGGIYVWYLSAARTQQDLEPIQDPLRLFGIIAYVLVLSTAAYSLRRRFVRGLPGKVQNWLWMHTWIGIITILIVFLHENYAYITHDTNLVLTELTQSYWGPSALFALIFLVVSGITGRLLDLWQTHVIAHEASTNGVGIVSALEERMLELEYTIERLCAGKSEPFKEYCLRALSHGTSGLRMPALAMNEHIDFQRAHETLDQREHLVQSRQRQRRARFIIRIWRTIHITLAVLALLVISYHGIMELLVNVFHVIKDQA